MPSKKSSSKKTAKAAAKKTIAPKKASNKKSAAKKTITKAAAAKKTGKNILHDRKVSANKKVDAIPKNSMADSLTIPQLNLPPAEEQLLLSLNQKTTGNKKPLKLQELEKKLIEFNFKKTDTKKLLQAVNKINPDANIPVTRLPEDIKKSTW